MTTIIATDRDGSVTEFTARDGFSLMENLRDTAGFDVASICGGSCSCATCHVYIGPEFADRLPKQAPDERELVEFLDAYRPTSRLSCQIMVSDRLDGLRVELAPEE